MWWACAFSESELKFNFEEQATFSERNNIGSCTSRIFLDIHICILTENLQKSDLAQKLSKNND